MNCYEDLYSALKHLETPFVLTGAVAWGALNVGFKPSIKTKCRIYLKQLPKEQLDEDIFEVFTNVSFPSTKPTREWYIVDLFNNRANIYFDEEQALRTIKQQIGKECSLEKLATYLKDYGTDCFSSYCSSGNETAKRSLTRIFPFPHESAEFTAMLEAAALYLQKPCHLVLFDYWVYHFIYNMQLLTEKMVYLKGATSLVAVHRVAERMTTDLDMMLWDTHPVQDWKYVPGAMTAQVFEKTKVRQAYYETLEATVQKLPGLFLVCYLIIIGVSYVGLTVEQPQATGGAYQFELPTTVKATWANLVPKGLTLEIKYRNDFEDPTLWKLTTSKPLLWIYLETCPVSSY